MFNGFLDGIVVMIGVIVINMLVGNILELRMMGKIFGFFILVVMFLLFFWGWLFGIVGMLFFVFFIMVLKIVLEFSFNII